VCIIVPSRSHHHIAKEQTTGITHFGLYKMTTTRANQNVAMWNVAPRYTKPRQVSTHQLAEACMSSLMRQLVNTSGLSMMAVARGMDQASGMGPGSRYLESSARAVRTLRYRTRDG
jgi:hypothetical protein